MIFLNVTSPLPVTRNPNAATSRLPEGADFVDDETVLRVIAGPVCRRDSLFANEAFLTAEDTDFAGWRPLSLPDPQIATATPPFPVPQPIPATGRSQPAAHDGSVDSPIWFNAAAAVFCLGLLGIAILSQHPINPPAARWLSAQPPLAEQAVAIEASPTVPQALTSATTRSH